MSDREFTVRKNILDLEHSEKLSRGITELSLGVGGFISVSGFIFNKNFLTATSLAIIFAMVFFVDGIRKLDDCKKIRNQIEELRKNFPPIH